MTFKPLTVDHTPCNFLDVSMDTIRDTTSHSELESCLPEDGKICTWLGHVYQIRTFLRQSCINLLHYVV